MSEEIPETYPPLCPYIYYEDTAAMIDWLTNAFGFRERFKEVRQDGSLGHVEMELGDAVIMMGNPPGYKNPTHLGQVSVGMGACIIVGFLLLLSLPMIGTIRRCHQASTRWPPMSRRRLNWRAVWRRSVSWRRSAAPNWCRN